MSASMRHAARMVAFGGVLLASTWFRETDDGGLHQAIVWLPTGVAIAGVWLLGWAALAICAIAAAASRILLDYPPWVVVAATFGSTAEAAVGVALLRATGLRGDFSRLRDSLALFLTATIAPLASIACSWLSQLIPGAWGNLQFFSGWNGWWRMNALGVLMVLPVMTIWLAPTPPGLARHRRLESVAWLVAALGVTSVIVETSTPGPTAIMLLFAVLPLALVATLRCGQRCAVTIAAASTLLVVWQTTDGQGPFQCVPIVDRHVAAQLFALTMIGVPLVLGSLVAERETTLSQWQQGELVRESLLGALPDIGYRLAADGTILAVTGPTDVPLARPRELLVGQNLPLLSGPQTGSEFAAAIATTIAGERPRPIEYRIDTTAGRRSREARFVRLDEHEVLVLVRDITERDRAQRLLEWQAQILEQIATDRPEQDIFLALVRGLQDLAAPGLGSLLLLQGRQLRVVCAPDLPPEYNALIDGLTIGPEVGSCGAAAHGNRPVIAADTATHPNWAAYRAAPERFGLRACWSVPVRAPGGEVVGTFAIYHSQPREPMAAEIATVERAAVLAGIAIDRTRREGLLSAIHRNVQDGIYRSVPDRGLVYANDAFARAFGYASPGELLSAIATGTVPPGAHADDLARFAPEATTPAVGEQQLHRRDGMPFWARLSRTVVGGPDTGTIACDGALADITEQRHLADQLRQAQKMEAIGKLAGGVAHDFNNLLTAITGFAEAIRDRTTDPAIAADADEVLHASERAASLTRRLLAFSRQQVLAPQVVDLGAIVDGTAGMLHRLIGEHIRLVVATAGGPWPVRVDKGQIEQVLLNLALNARDAMPDGGTLTIALSAEQFCVQATARRHGAGDGAQVLLTVQDTGAGMDEATRSRAFEPFFTTKEPGKGTGLGLATVYGIVRQSDGAIWIDSSPGHGTTVHVCLPRAAVTDGAPKAAAAPAPAPAGTARILLAEDEELVRDLLQRLLVREGHRVTACADGAEALAAAGEPVPYDLLVTDTVMPRMGGPELARRLQTRCPGLPVLLLSGYASDDLPIDDEHLGPIEFLPKPFVAAELLAALARLRARAAAPSAGWSTPPTGRR